MCGVFTLTVAVPATDFNSYRAKGTVGWTNNGTTTTGNDSSDYDVYIYAPDATGSQTAKAGSSANPDVAQFNVSNRTHPIYVTPYDFPPSGPVHATKPL